MIAVSIRPKDVLFHTEVNKSGYIVCVSPDGEKGQLEYQGPNSVTFLTLEEPVRNMNLDRHCFAADRHQACIEHFIKYGFRVFVLSSIREFMEFERMTFDQSK